MNRLVLLFLSTSLLLGMACNNKGTPIVQDDIAHDGSSKIWISTEYILDGVKQQFQSRQEQFFLVLQADGKIMMGILAFFDKPEQSGVGKYEIATDRSSIKIYWSSGDVAEYGIVELNSKKMIFEEKETRMRLVFEPYSIPAANPEVSFDAQPGELLEQAESVVEDAEIVVE